MSDNEVKEVQKAKPIWLLIGFILAPLGGIVGLYLGSKYAYGNYDRFSKLMGWIMMIFSLVIIRVITES